MFQIAIILNCGAIKELFSVFITIDLRYAKNYLVLNEIGFIVNLYQEVLMDHYRNPRNNGMVVNPSFCVEQRNSSCGDEVLFTGIIENNILVEVAFQGKGCVISQATASLLSERIAGMSLDDIRVLDQNDLCAMLGMQLGPVRLLCALLSLMALQKGIEEYRNK